MNKSGILYIVIFVLVLVFSFNIDVDAEVDKGSQNAVSQVQSVQSGAVINDHSILALLEQASAEATKLNAMDQINSNRAGYVSFVLALALGFCLILAYKNGLLFHGQTKGNGKKWYDIKEHMND